MDIFKKKYVYALVMLAVGLGSCRDEALSPYVDPLPGVNGFAAINEATSDFGKLLPSPSAPPVNTTSFSYSKWVSSGSPFIFRWFSFDKKITITKVEFYAYFSEPYTDADGNPAVANHGGATPTGGKLIPALTLSNLENGKKTTVNVTAAQVYDLYKDAEFDYNGDKVKEKVFANAKRTVNRRFLPTDNVLIRWKLYAADGTVYRSWSPSIESGEPAFANASFKWGLSLPAIVSIDNISTPGQVISIKGGDFSDVPEEIEVTFNGVKLAPSDIVSVSNSEIKIKVPGNVVAGKKYPVIVSVVGFKSNAFSATSI